MLKVLDCIVTEHDLRLVAVAALVCLLASLTTAWLFGRAQQLTGRARHVHGGTAGVTVALGAWATHFIAMLAFAPSTPARYLLPGTALSLVVALVGAILAITAGSRRSARLPHRLAAGALLGGSIAAMHYLGMSAFRTHGLLLWDADRVVASVAIGAGLGAAALAVANGERSLKRRIGCGLLLTLAIAGLHFTGMSAVAIAPDPTIGLPGEALPTAAVAAAVTLMAVVLISAAAAVAILDVISERSSFARLSTAVEAMADGLAFFDANGRCSMWNRRYAEFAPPGFELKPGFTLEDIMRAGLAAGCYPDAIGREREWLERGLAANANPAGPVELRLSSGVWLRVTERRLPDGSMVTTCSDITEMKRHSDLVEAARVEAVRANQAKSEFLATMSHEIRTPLNGVLGMAQAIAADELTPVQRERVEVIRQAGGTLLGLLNDLLDLSRVEAGAMELEDGSIDFEELCASASATFAGLAAEKGVALSVSVADEVKGRWRGDPARVRQIVCNLLNNAVKFTHAGEISLRASHDGERVRVAVADTGDGVAPERLNQLFAKFVQGDASTTRRYGGSGLGLAICRELAELMGGGVEAASEPGRGSVFTLVLPLERDIAVAEEASIGPVADLPPAGLSILVAEDNAVNRLVIQTLLGQMGVATTLVEEGASAVEAAANQQFDAILMDVQMPVMDGLEATVRIRAAEAAAGHARTPIVALTADAMAHQRARCFEAGMDAVVAKPIDVAELIETLGRLLDEPEPDAERACA